MPKKYSEQHMQTVYTLVQQGTKIKDISVLLGVNPGEVNNIYNAALRRTWPHYQARMKKAKSRRKTEVQERPSTPGSLTRVPAVYSNRSPYGIASGGM